MLTGKLCLVEARIKPVACQQLCVPAGLDDTAAIEHADQVGTNDGRESVRDDDRRAALHQAAQRRLDLSFGLAVKRRGRLVEQQDRRIPEHRARDCQALPLPTG